MNYCATLAYGTFLHKKFDSFGLNPLNAKLNPICNLLALLGAHHILHVGRIRVKQSSNNEVFSIYMTLTFGISYSRRKFSLHFVTTERQETLKTCESESVKERSL